jgi:hypothetical protein
VRRSKGDRRASRRAALATLAAMTGAGGSRAPPTVRSACGHRVELTALAQQVAYREVSGVLQGATQAHLLRNPVLHALLGLDEDSLPEDGKVRC